MPISQNSPFLNIPAKLNKKQAVFFDGMRHAAQIAELSYTRLCSELSSVAKTKDTSLREKLFTCIFLDAWAFIDAVDRFRSLWEMQPNASTIPEEFSPRKPDSTLQSIRDVRNVSAHISQKIDQIVSLNSSVLGSINWVSILSTTPPRVGTFFIRPGIAMGSVKGQLAMPGRKVAFVNGSGCISITAGKHEVNLSDAYDIIESIINFAENGLQLMFGEIEPQNSFPSDVFGSAELNVSGLTIPR